MAGHARYTAVLDACVLYPVCIADALMSMAVAGLFAAKWTTLIEDEWIRNLEERRPDLVGKLVRRRDDMRQAIPDWEVLEANWRAVASGLSLPDPDDVHVLAAAIAGHADCIVTANLKDCLPAQAIDATRAGPHAQCVEVHVRNHAAGPATGIVDIPAVDEIRLKVFGLESNHRPPDELDRWLFANRWHFPNRHDGSSVLELCAARIFSTR